MFIAIAGEDAVKVSKISVTEACFPSSAPKSCEKHARPIVSRLPNAYKAKETIKKRKGVRNMIHPLEGVQPDINHT